MKGEQLKSILLILLVISSLLLTLAIWNHQPDFEMSGDEENLVDPHIEEGHRLTRNEVLKPIYIIYHNQNNEKPVSLSDKTEEQDVFTSILDYSLYNFSAFNLNEEWLEDEVEDRAEVVFSTELPSETIYDLFSVDQDISIPELMFNRIEIIFDQKGDYHLIFRNDHESQVIGASLQDYPREVERLKGFFDSEDFISYEVYESSRGTDMYLPNEIDPNILLFSYTDIPVDPFKNFLFSTPSIVRSARTFDGNTVFIDGTRELTLESDQISFTNQTNEHQVSDQELSYYELFDQVHNFINTHNGFTFEQPFHYFLSHLENTTRINKVEFTLSYQGIPIFSDQNISNISVAWHNQEVYQYNHPLVTLVEQRGVNSESANLPDADTVIEILNSENYQRSAIYDVMVGYRIREQISGQGQVYELIPTWYVKGINGWNPLTIPPEETGGDNSALGTN
ncbi:YycH family regulatory protein [Amphibacillus sp. Q70]|uniref:YycH family regulatory protein n=1 Tax=Amphibacillus sp. Q70 TaxID=3453416 RepID=UPI003F834939